MWGKIIIPLYRLWLNGLYGLYGPWCPLSSKRPINLISLSLSLVTRLAPSHYQNYNGVLLYPKSHGWRYHYGYGLSQWEMTLHCNVISHWLSLYPKWSLGCVLNSLQCLHWWLISYDVLWISEFLTGGIVESPWSSGSLLNMLVTRALLQYKDHLSFMESHYKHKTLFDCPIVNHCISNMEYCMYWRPPPHSLHFSYLFSR